MTFTSSCGRSERARAARWAMLLTLEVMCDCRLEARGDNVARTNHQPTRQPVMA